MTPYIEQLGFFVLITSHPRWSLAQKRSPRFSPLARTRGRKVNTWVSWSGFNLLGKFGTTDAAHLLSSRPSVPSPVCPWVNVRTVLLKKKIWGPFYYNWEELGRRTWAWILKAERDSNSKPPGPWAFKWAWIPWLWIFYANYYRL